jgi:regulator of chromosome condensation
MPFQGNQGSLGFSGDSQYQFLPIAILDLSSHTPRGQEPEKFVSFAAGNNHLLVLTHHGNIYALGAGEEGQLGRRVLERRKIHGTKPEKVVLGARSRKAVLVGTGNNHSFAVDEAGDTWAWGLNSKGQAGTGVSNLKTDGEVHAPARVKNLSKEELGGTTVVEIAGGDHHTLFLTSDGRVFACGRSEDGQLGLADDHPAFEDRVFEDFLPEPVQITFPDMNDRIVNISAGTHGNMAVSADGVLYAWGVQAQGELGLGDESGAKTPTVIVRKTGQWAAVKASCGGQHSVALLKKREVDED